MIKGRTMEIILAKHAGYCYGVAKAIDMAEALAQNGPVKTFGELIHNNRALERLEDLGVHLLDTPQAANANEQVMIRAHGVSKEIEQQLRDRAVQLTDATCVFVKRIHQLVSEQSQLGAQVIIVGDPNHPEVQGIAGWCLKPAWIIQSTDEVENLPDTDAFICIVAQTTFRKSLYDDISHEIKKKFALSEKFDTICNATVQRQEEARRLSRLVDAMVVVGGRQSSNTQKLLNICKEECPYAFLVEGAHELSAFDPHIQKVGITAGASTPEWVIEEVIRGMEDMINKQEGEMSFSEAFEQTMTELSANSVVKGKIIGYNNNEVFVDLGYKADGLIAMDEFLDDPGFDPEKDLKTGTEIEALVVKINDGEGNVALSKKKVDSIRGMEKMETAFENKEPLDAIVKEVVKGGLVADYKGVRVFIPASQVSDRFIKDLAPFVGKPIRFMILEMNRSKRRVVGSCRTIIETEKAKLSDDFWGNIEIGKEYAGTVKSLTKFGAFVDLGAVDGLIHISELSWGKINDPSEVLSVGDNVKVRILNFDPETKKLSLGYRKQEDNPWFEIGNKYHTGDTVTGTVIRIVPFGAFVELEPGVEGLVHISQISTVRIARVEEVLEIGHQVDMKVLEVNTEFKKISLSIRDVQPIDPIRADVPAPEAAGNASEHKEAMGNTIGDILGEIKE